MRTLSFLLILSLVALIAGTGGFLVGTAGVASDAGQSALRAVTRGIANAADGHLELDSRRRVLVEYPEVASRIASLAGFGGTHSPTIAQDFFATDGPGIEEARRLAEIREVAPRTWLIRLPTVNVPVFETDEGLVLVDAGMGVAGPAILEQIRRVSDAPLHTIIYTHGHADHAYGTWALLADGPGGKSPEIVAHEALPVRFERYIRLRGSIAQYMTQPLASLPSDRDDLVWPTRTFRDRLELEIGGETFLLVHREGETDDQLYVWVPSREVLASADYYQGFLPNAGNGKRVPRYVGEWIVALREMVALEPRILLPGHGEPMDDPALIRENLTVLADGLEYIREHTLDGLNRGLRKDEIYRSVELPEPIAGHPTMAIRYVTPQDISKMILKRYAGWWDDVPSSWAPAPLEDQARAIASLAGTDALIARARELISQDLALASHLADWAFFAEPDHPAVQDLMLDVYRARILHPDSQIQEILVYLDAMTRARTRQLASRGEYE